MNDAPTSTEQRAAQRVGQLLREKWRLDRLIGVGGMAAVYGATHRNQSRGAVKLLHAELSASPEVRERFLREGYAANSVDHPGTVKVLDDDVTEDGSVFLVMELLDGAPLDSIAAGRPGAALRPIEVLFVADQLLDVLAAAHDKGILHRDIKPENLFVTREGRIKVLDFGLARLREGDVQKRATTVGMPMGTPAFMAPEQALGYWHEVDARSDLWAVGATMFTLLTGRLVHEAQTTQEMLVHAATRPAPAIATRCPALDRGLAALVDRALGFSRDERWPDARRMQSALRELPLARELVRSSELVAARLLDPAPLSDTGLSAAAVAATMVDTDGLPTRRVVLESGGRSISAVARDSGGPATAGRGGRRLIVLAAAACVIGIGAAGWMLVSGGARGEDGSPAGEQGAALETTSSIGPEARGTGQALAADGGAAEPIAAGIRSADEPANAAAPLGGGPSSPPAQSAAPPRGGRPSSSATVAAAEGPSTTASRALPVPTPTPATPSPTSTTTRTFEGRF